MAHRRTKRGTRLRRWAVLGGLIAALTAYRNRAIAISQRRFQEQLTSPTGEPSSNGQVPAGSAVLSR